MMEIRWTIVVLQARQWASNRQENGTQRRNPGFFQSQEGKQQLQGLDERPRDQQVSYYDSASDGNSCECGTRLTRSQLA